MTDGPNHTDAGDASQRTARLFAALWLPPVIVEQLSAHLDTCWGGLSGAATPSPVRPRHELTPEPRLRRTRSDTWHVTLAFLGEASLARSIGRFQTPSRGIPDALELPAPGPLQLAGSGSFGPAVWVGVAHDGWLTALAGIMQRRLAVRDRRFHAHVTVGRVRGRGTATADAPGNESPHPRSGSQVGSDALVSRAVTAIGDWRGPSWTPTEVVLVQSLLGPHPSYPIQARLPLV